MLSRSVLLAGIVVPFLNNAIAQFPPKPEGFKVVQSKFHEGVKISYKEPHICETTPGVKSYAGYVHLPPNTLSEPHENQPYPINTFFWFFEARKDPHNAPLSIWLNGGPGGSSLYGGLTENGPCFVNNDSNSTYLNPWSWNNEVNMLYIDQPVQVGFSYDTLANITFAIQGFWDNKITVTDFSEGVPEQNATFLVGTSGSQNVTLTANSTQHAAVALWHFAQTWFEEFPVYKPHDEKISLFTESYGGKYGPGFVSHFMRQNELIANGTISGPGVHYLHLDTLGIINGCIDSKYQSAAYIDFAWNNTYGIQAFSESQYHHSMYELLRPNGIQDQVEECQRLAAARDPERTGNDPLVNAYCHSVESYAENFTTRPYFATERFGWFDITHSLADPLPSNYFVGFLNQAWVQAALGVPVNFSSSSQSVGSAFNTVADHARGGMPENIAYLLDKGIKVHMMYGDRDFACNWKGGEVVSLNIPSETIPPSLFSSAGYAPLEISPFRSAGLTRQVGNFSFSRIYQAGHMVPFYQPEAAYEVFMRALTNRDIATGKVNVLESAKEGKSPYMTKGRDNAWWIKSEVLSPPAPECYIREPGTCTQEQWEGISNGSAVIKDGIMVGWEDGREVVDREDERVKSMKIIGALKNGQVPLE